MKMNWYYFGSIIFVYVILKQFKRKSQENRFRFLIFLSAVNVVFYFYNLWYFYLRSHILTLLPLQLCNIGVFLIPIALMIKKSLLMDFLFYACGLGALTAILIVSEEYENTYSMFTFTFYVFHFLIFIIPVFSFTWGFYDLKPSIDVALKVTLILIILSIFIHGLNVWLNTVYHIPANYFFTIRELAVPTNQAFAFFAQLIPYDYFYMYVVFPIMYGYMAFVHIVMKLLPKKRNMNSFHMQFH